MLSQVPTARGPGFRHLPDLFKPLLPFINSTTTFPAAPAANAITMASGSQNYYELYRRSRYIAPNRSLLYPTTDWLTEDWIASALL